MTLGEAIAQVDELKPNAIPQLTKVLWLSTLDGLVKRNVFDTHGTGLGEFPGYGPQTSLDTALLVEAPYDTLYRRWLEAQIDLTNAEYDRYNAAIRVFSDEYGNFENDYNRSHPPARQGSRFLF